MNAHALSVDVGDLLTTADVAALTRAPVSTVRYWRHLGSGPRSFRLGRRVVYLRSDVDAWIAAQRDTADDGRDQLVGHRPIGATTRVAP